MRRHGFISIYVILGIALVCLICLAIIARNWSCRHRRDPRPPRIVTYGPYDVVSVDSGIGMTVKVGRRDKSTRQVILDAISIPADTKWADVAKGHLKELAGGSVTVQAEKHGIFRESDSNAHASLQDGRADVEVLQEGDSGAEARGPDDWKEVECPECDGTGKSKLESNWKQSVAMALWMNGHSVKCPQCKQAIIKDTQDYCSVAGAKWGELGKKYPPEETSLETCSICNGSGVMYEEQPGVLRNARGPLVGVVLGSSGINLNLAQVEGGYATCGDTAPKEWIVARNAAKKAKKGMWSK